MSDLISNLPNNMVKGITLSNQHIDLFHIIDDTSKTEEQKKTEMIKYLEETKKRSASKSGKMEVVSEYIDYTAQKLQLSEEDKVKFINVIRKNLPSVFKRDEMIEILKKEGFDNAELLNDTLIEATDTILSRAKEGISDFLVLDKDGKPNVEASYQKVMAFYEHVISEGRYNRINFDDIASPTSFMAIQTDKTRPKKLNKAIEFCKKHNLSGKINSAFFYMHSHYPDNPSLTTKEDLIDYYNRYFDNISEIVQGSPVRSMDIFNEFVYRDQPQKIGENDYQYGQRHNGFHALLSLDDICQIVQRARKKMPEVEFVYNDDGWDKAEKRPGIFREIEEIRKHGDKLIDAIGMQFHTSVNIDINEIRKAVEECKSRFPDLNINITELDISEKIEGFDYENASPQELLAAQRVATFRKKQMMQSFKKLAEEGKISELTIWSQSDEMCFRGNDTKSSLNSYSQKENVYSGKDIEYSQEELWDYLQDISIVSRNIALNLAKQIRLNPQSLKNYEQIYKELAKGYMPEVIKYFDSNKDEILSILEQQTREPVQDFNAHTHTLRCGHADGFTEDFEYVNEALKTGMREIIFTDHVPFPKGEGIEPKVRMQYEEINDYLASIEYLKKEYKGLIDIGSGFEFEYLPKYKNHLQNLKSKTDLMILGQHFVERNDGARHYINGTSSKLSDEDLALYGDTVENAINSGLPDIIAHPDIFMVGREEFSEEEKRVAIQICKAAKNKNIPLEINMGDILKSSHRVNPNLSNDERMSEIVSRVKYPCREFWQIASQIGCKVVYGKDAHYPNQISEEKDYEIVKAVLGNELVNSLNFSKAPGIGKSLPDDHDDR